MKKITVILVAFLFLCGMSALSFVQAAQTPGMQKSEIKTEIIRGKIISIDIAKHEIVVKTKAGEEKTIVVNSKVVRSLKVDEEVRVTLKGGSNVAMKIKKIINTMHASTKK